MSAPHSLDSDSPTHQTPSRTSQPSSPSVMSLLKFLSTPTSASASSPSMSSATSALSSTPPSPLNLTGPMRSQSEAAIYSPSMGPNAPKIKLQRSRSLETDPFRLNDGGGIGNGDRSIPSSLPSSPTMKSSAPSSTILPYRTFTISSGLPMAEAQRKHSNSFLELLCKQDSFMGSD